MPPNALLSEPRASPHPLVSLSRCDHVEWEEGARMEDARHERMDRVRVLYAEITAATH